MTILIPKQAHPTQRVEQLEHHSVAERRQRPLAPMTLPIGDLSVAELKELRELDPGQRPVARSALQLGQMPGGVQMIKQLLRAAAELALADRRPRIPPILTYSRNTFNDP